MKKRLKMVGADFGKCLKYSSLASMVLVIVDGIFGLILSGGSLLTAMENIKAILFFVGSA